VGHGEVKVPLILMAHRIGELILVKVDDPGQAGEFRPKAEEAGKIEIAAGKEEIEIPVDPVELGRQLEGSGPHPPLPVSGRLSQQNPLMGAPAGKPVEKGPVTPPVEGLNGQNAKSLQWMHSPDLKNTQR